MIRVSILALAAFFAFGPTAQAGCNPVKSDVVSVGQKAARFYSERSLQQAIASEKDRLETIGAALGPITKAIDCQPYPNLIGADEWRCIGSGKVCTK
jgi:hypothetical protein